MKFNAENRLVRATDVRAHTRVTSDVNAFVSFLIIFFSVVENRSGKGAEGNNCRGASNSRRICLARSKARTLSA